MTQPDGYDPGNFAPLSVTSQKTQEDWENEIRADLAPAFNPLEVAASWIINSIQGLIDTIIEALTGLPVVGGALEDVFDALDGLWNTAQSALDGVGQLAWNLLNDPVGTLGQIPMMLVDGLESTIDGILDALQQVPIIGDVIRIISGLGSRLFGFIPLANIADEPQTLLWNPGFTGAVSLEPGSGWSWDSTVYRTGGDSEPGSAKAVADGTLKVLRSNSASVAAGKKLPVEVHVLADGLTGSGDLLQLGLLFFNGDTQVDSIIVDSVGVPSDPHAWAAGVAGARMATLSGEVTIPEGVNRVQMRLIVTGNATAGTVWWDDADMKLSGLLQQSWVDGLPQALQDIIGFAQSIIDTVVQAITGVPVVGDFLGELFDAVDSLFNDAQDALSGLSDLAWNLLNNPVAVLGQIPQSLVSGLQTTLNQIGDIFNGLVVTPVNNIVAAIANWFHSFFGGGSNQMIPLAQKGAANGVAPLDANAKVPWANLPEIVVPEGEKHPHILLTLPASQTIPDSTETLIEGWQWSGSETPVFDEDSAKFQLPRPGWWSLESQVVWSGAGSGTRESALVRTIFDDSELVVEAASGAPGGRWGARSKTMGMMDVTSETSPLSEDDYFGVKVFQTSGGPLDVVAGYPDGTYVLATYLGERQEDIVSVSTVQFDATGLGATGSSPNMNWSHNSSGPNRAVVGFLYFVSNNVGATTRTMTYGGVPMTSLGYVEANGVFVEPFILLNQPEGPVTVNASVTGAAPIWFAGSTVSYTGVGGYRPLMANTGSGTELSHGVSSQPHRMVAQSFVARLSLPGSYSQTARVNIPSATTTAGAVIGDAAGAVSVNFTASIATAQDWASAAVDLRAAGEPGL